MIKQQYERPIDTAADLVEKNITLFIIGAPTFIVTYQFHMKQLATPDWIHVSKNMITAPSCVDRNVVMESCLNIKGTSLNLIHNKVFGDGTHAFIRPYLYEDNVYPETPINFNKKMWWRSEETVPGLSPFGGYRTNKIWALNEVC